MGGGRRVRHRAAGNAYFPAADCAHFPAADRAHFPAVGNAYFPTAVDRQTTLLSIERCRPDGRQMA
ncbi:hypothetical protein ACGFW5_35195 [Streptomyces sp. NPDC048416]|uniref:hypothetical protein n=1 Tax=Streptomyces sp. NPDC048416 TaxID=3365546 RepID=UPI0037183D11